MPCLSEYYDYALNFPGSADIVERLWRENVTEPVVVTLDTGEILFAVSKGVIQ